METIAEGIDQIELDSAPVWIVAQARTEVVVMLRGDFGVKFANAFVINMDFGAGSAVAVVFCEVQDESVAGDLHVERQVGLEAVFPIDVEAKIVDVKFAGFLY